MKKRYMDGRNDTVKGYYAGYTSQSEDAGIMDRVIYDGYRNRGRTVGGQGPGGNDERDADRC